MGRRRSYQLSVYHAVQFRCGHYGWMNWLGGEAGDPMRPPEFVWFLCVDCEDEKYLRYRARQLSELEMV